MTYDPYRNPSDLRRSYYDRNPTSGAGAAVGMLLVLTLLVLGGFIYYLSLNDTSTVARNEMRAPITQPSTTGSAPSAEADSVTPIPPQPPREAQ